MRALLAAALIAAAAVTPARADETRTVSGVFTTAGADHMSIEFPSGTLTLVAGEGDSIVAVMKAHCRHGDCMPRIEQVRLVSEREGSVVHLALQGYPKWNHHGLEISLRLEIPRRLAVDVDMGAGDLAVRGLQQDVALRLGAGDVVLQLPESAVRSVRAHVGLGDATLHGHRGNVDGSGFLGKTLRWTDGTGASRVRVDLGVGDVSVSLD